MPITDTLILAAIVFAFAAFGFVLAWAEYQTRNVRIGPVVQNNGHNDRQSQSSVGQRKSARAKDMVRAA